MPGFLTRHSIANKNARPPFEVAFSSIEHTKHVGGAWRALACANGFLMPDLTVIMRRSLVCYVFYEYLSFVLNVGWITRYHHLSPTENALRKLHYTMQFTRIQG